MNAEELRNWTRQFALKVVFLCRNFKDFPETKTIQYQLIKSSTSVAANYRAACRARSKNEWFSKISIVVEEIDETNFWLDFIQDLAIAPQKELQNLLIESDRLMRIFSKARATAKRNKNNKPNLEEPLLEYSDIDLKFLFEEE